MEQQSFIEVLPPLKEHAAPNGGNGRPRGARNLKHRLLERLLHAEAPAVAQKVIAQALAGDMLAARIILDRVYPKPRTAPIGVDLPPTKTPAEIRQAMHELLAKIASGAIAPDDGQALMATMRDVLDAHRIQTFDAGIAVAAETTNARGALADKLAKAIEARKRQTGEAGEASSSESLS